MNIKDFRIEKEEKKLLDGGESRRSTVKAVERGRGVPVYSLMNGYAFGVSYDGVGRNNPGLVRVFTHVVELLRLGLGGVVVLVGGGVVGNSDGRLRILSLGPHSLLVPSNSTNGPIKHRNPHQKSKAEALVFSYGLRERKVKIYCFVLFCF